MEQSFKPLKMPTQARSRLTYQSILEATAYILIEDGYANLTTNHVAERAGVSIASLYQYFPNKESLVVTLHHEHAKSTRAQIQQAFVNEENASLETLVNIFVDAMINVHSVEPELHRVFQEEIPRLLKSEIIKEGNDEFITVLMKLTQYSTDSLEAQKNLAWMIRTMTHAVIHQALIDRPDDLVSGQLAIELKTILLKLL